MQQLWPAIDNRKHMFQIVAAEIIAPAPALECSEFCRQEERAVMLRIFNDGSSINTAALSIASLYQRFENPRDLLIQRHYIENYSAISPAAERRAFAWVLGETGLSEPLTEPKIFKVRRNFGNRINVDGCADTGRGIVSDKPARSAATYASKLAKKCGSGKA